MPLLEKMMQLRKEKPGMRLGTIQLHHINELRILGESYREQFGGGVHT
jgi:hypothetical protein